MRTESHAGAARRRRAGCGRIVLAFLALPLALTLPTSARAQDAGQATAEVRAVVDRLFNGMREGDSTAVRSVFHPQARLLTTAVRDGQVVMQDGGTVDDFVRAVGTPHDEVWDERVGEVEIRVDDPLATAWMTYRFHLGDSFSHCGVNAFQFLRADAGWQVIQITDTRRRDCPA